MQTAKDILDTFEDKWGKKYPNVINVWRNNWNELTTFCNLPIEMWRLVYTTNAIESYYRGIRKYMKNRPLFPYDVALTKLSIYGDGQCNTEMEQKIFPLEHYPASATH